MEIIAQLYPNNEIRLGMQEVRRRPPKRDDSLSDRVDYQRSLAQFELEVNCDRRNYPFWGTRACDGQVVWRKGNPETWADNWWRALDITSKVQRGGVKPQGKVCRLWKEKSFSANARHRMLEGGALMDRLGQQSYMVTMTVPGSGGDVSSVVASFSPWIMNRVLQQIRRSKESFTWMYCWEFQKRGMLHVHLALCAEDESECRRVARKIRTQWYRCLTELSMQHGIDCFGRPDGFSWSQEPRKWQYNIQPVMTTVGGYLSKYLSKNATPNLLRGFTSGGRPRFPSRFWGMSRNLVRRIESERVRLSAFLSAEDAERVFVEVREVLREAIVQSYSYEFCLGGKSCGQSIGHGMRDIIYINPDSFRDKARGFIRYVSTAISNVTGEFGEFTAQRTGAWQWRPSRLLCSM